MKLLKDYQENPAYFCILELTQWTRVHWTPAVCLILCFIVLISTWWGTSLYHSSFTGVASVWSLTTLLEGLAISPLLPHRPVTLFNMELFPSVIDLTPNLLMPEGNKIAYFDLVHLLVHNTKHSVWWRVEIKCLNIGEILNAIK